MPEGGANGRRNSVLGPLSLKRLWNYPDLPLTPPLSAAQRRKDRSCRLAGSMEGNEAGAPGQVWTAAPLVPPSEVGTEPGEDQPSSPTSRLPDKETEPGTT